MGVRERLLEILPEIAWVKDATLREQVIAMRMSLPFSIGYIPREQNQVADELAQHASHAGPG